MTYVRILKLNKIHFTYTFFSWIAYFIRIQKRLMESQDIWFSSFDNILRNIISCLVEFDLLVAFHQSKVFLQMINFWILTSFFLSNAFKIFFISFLFVILCWSFFMGNAISFKFLFIQNIISVHYSLFVWLA